MPTKRSEAPRAGYHHGNLRDALVQAALELVAEHGPTGFTLREAARRVGVSHAAPYRHFPDRGALLGAVAFEGFVKMRALMERARRPLVSPLERLGALGVAYVKFAVSHPSHFRVMFSAEASQGLQEMTLPEEANAFGLLLEEIQSGQKAGLLRKGDPQELALPAWAIVHGLASLSIEGLGKKVSGPKRSAEALAKAVTRMLVEGLAAR